MEGVEPKMRGVKTNLFIMAFVAVLLALGAWAVQTKLASNARAEVARSLTIVRDTTHLAVKTWYKSQKAAAAVWADAPKIRETAARLLALPPHQAALLDSPAQQELRDWFRPIRKATRYQGYFIVGPNQINLASSRDQNVGVENLLVGQKGFLSGAWAGRQAVSLPIRSDVPLSDRHGRLVSGLPSIFVAAPIRGEDTGKVIAIFMFRLDPEEGFTNTLKQGRIGKTGETYAFDGEGRLISQSRFDDQLHESGLIPEGERGILNIQLRDPGVNLIKGENATVPRSQQPFTHMAKSAIRGEAGIDLNGYRDYRGVPVVAAWVWDTELGLGVSTELDAQEAYQTLRATRWTIVTLSVFVFFLLVALTVIYTLFQQRRMAEEELRRAATVFDNTDEGIIVTNVEADIVLVNNAFTDITGYKPEDVLGKNPRIQQSGRHDAAFYQAMWHILNRDGQWRGEIWNRRKNGDIYPAWENINAVKDAQGRITNYVAIFSDISVLKESEERMAELAHHDALTGLPNRLRFIANLEQAIESAKRRKHKVALMFLDLDRFKYINDTLGHNVGDELLKTIAGRLKSCVRAEDTVARLGGDEFTVVLTEVAHAEDAGLIADKIVKAIRKPVTVSGETIDTSASLGISIFPDDALECEAMVKAADTAMYHAKEVGKSSFQFFTAGLASWVFEHALIEKGLRKALEGEEFELYYQPQVSLVDGKIAGVEALIRWNHPERGQLLPDSFIHVANDSDLIDAISEWVLRKALGDHEKWIKNGSVALRIAVNITGRQITREQSIKHILDILEELAPAPNVLQLDLEITETALEGTERTTNIINTLKNRGVMFAIDDFGTGHSSLSRLKQLPVDTLKIDRSFIGDIADEGDDKAIAAAIIAMAHSLGLRVIGEGVETESQFDVLRALHCDEIQGFYFSKPVPSGEMARLLEKSFH
jgi:diguanylate cyclase (GGDEF)-like protein/PAS domain S-box-containing protein